MLRSIKPVRTGDMRFDVVVGIRATDGTNGQSHRLTTPLDPLAANTGPFREIAKLFKPTGDGFSFPNCCPVSESPRTSWLIA